VHVIGSYREGGDSELIVGCHDPLNEGKSCIDHEINRAEAGQCKPRLFVRCNWIHLVKHKTFFFSLSSYHYAFIYRFYAFLN
jgi:hypothetical protein